MTTSTSKAQEGQDANNAASSAIAPLRPGVSLSRTVWVALIFCLLVSAAMLYQHSVAAERDPWKSPQLLALKEKLRDAPADESLRSEIRRLDLEFRQRYFRRLDLDNTGAWLLVGGMAVLLIAARNGVKIVARPHLPRRKTDGPQAGIEMVARSRWSVACVGVILITGLATLAFTGRSPLPDSATELDKLLGRSPSGGEVADIPSLAEFQTNWPRFRGAEGSGASKNSLNLSLGEKQGDGVIWKSPVPALGFNSPVVWSNRVFISGGDAARREVFCYDTADGKLLWQRAVENVPGSPAKPPEISDATGYAAGSMATDGRRAFVMFANGDLAALNFDGSPAWAKHLGIPRNTYGHASSLAIWPGKLIVQLDQDEGAPGGSKLLAFDCPTGKQLWERSKPTHSSWASPIIVEAGGKQQIITLALPFAMSHSLTDGNELWRAELMEGEITPSPIFASGHVIMVSPAGKLIAVRPDGSGDVTKSHIVWTAENNIPDVTSPVGNDELIFTATSGGMLTCFNAKDGKKVWQKDLDTEIQASPAIARNHLLLVSTKGEVVLVEVSREFKELGRTKLEDAFHASPAFANGRVYLRGAKNLFCLGTSSDKLATK
ncbi:MAG: PQQ-binding-like beta-propeller repeat protein [Verrucomicrobia bacterium]|nr:PQQ-binding-like beta-propeller repeat protein [Verrucomicrobiota bacterium]